MSALSIDGSTHAPPIAITRPLDALLRAASERFAVLACATPTNAAREQERLVEEWSTGRESSPRWTPPVVDRPALQATMRDVARAHAAVAHSSDPWLRAYAARLEELSLDLDLVDASFGAAVIATARRRFATTADDARGAEILARSWIATPAPIDEERAIETDDERHPASLVQQMRRAISSNRIGARVIVRDRIGALAAAGDGVVVVARGRRATAREAARVVLHEIEGHVLPRERARSVGPGLRALGSAGSSEDEEGRALALEASTNMLDARRMRTLAARHVAAAIVERGGSFHDTTRTLRDAHGLRIDDALSIASRVMRGAFERGGDVFGGVMRERVYLPAFVRVTAAVERGAITLESLGDSRLSIAARQSLPAMV